jgi:hypothetical protein
MTTTAILRTTTTTRKMQPRQQLYHQKTIEAKSSEIENRSVPVVIRTSEVVLVSAWGLVGATK